MICAFTGKRHNSPPSGDRLEENLVRYVIVITAVAFFVIWDGLYNHSEYLERFVSMLNHAVRWAGL
jgi:hypothetical protein